MSNRIIRDGLIDSEAVSDLHDKTFRLYVHLLLSADDYGLVAIDFGSIKRSSALLDWTREMVAKMLGELVDATLILPYAMEGKQYAAISKWRTRFLAMRPKYPMPVFGMAHVLAPYGYKTDTVKNAVWKFCPHLKDIVPAGDTPETPQSSAGEAPDTEQGTVNSEQGSVVLDTSSANPPMGDLKPPKSPGHVVKASEIKEVLDTMNQLAGTKYPVKNPKGSLTKAAELIKDRFKDGYTLDQFADVITNKYRDWQYATNGGGQPMLKWFTPETLFTKAHFEKYLAEKSR